MTQARQGIRAPDRPCADHLDRPASIHRLAVPQEVAFWLVAYIFGITILGTSLPAPCMPSTSVNDIFRRGS
jgi:hypothetical protein